MFETKEEAHFWKGFYIKLYKTETKYGSYNQHPKGGRGNVGPHLDETKEKCGYGNKGKKNVRRIKRKKSTIR